MSKRARTAYRPLEESFTNQACIVTSEKSRLRNSLGFVGGEGAELLSRHEGSKGEQKARGARLDASQTPLLLPRILTELFSQPYLAGARKSESQEAFTRPFFHDVGSCSQGQEYLGKKQKLSSLKAYIFPFCWLLRPL